MTPLGSITLNEIRVPRNGDLYIGKDNTLKMCRKTNYSTRGRSKLIVKFNPYGEFKNGFKTSIGEASKAERSEAV